MSDTTEANPFASIDPQMGAPKADDDNPFSTIFPAGVMPEKVSGLSSFASSAARGLLPAGGGMVGAGAGAEAGAAIGSLGGPIGTAIGGFVGGLGGFFAGSSATAGAQDWALKQAPDNWQEALGQSDRQQRLQEQQHPYYSFLGGIAPYALTMSPGSFTAKALNLPADATTFQRIIANPVTGRLFGGAAMGGMELGQEAWDGQTPDWAKVGISTGFGVVFNKPTRFGEFLTHAGAAPFRAVEPLAAPEPTVAQAADLGVIGPGVTESTFQGGTEQSDATKITAHNAAADEDIVTGAPAEPDLHPIARRLDPEAFQQNDDLLARRDSLRDFISQQSNPTPEMFDDLASKQSEVEAALSASNPRSPDAGGYRVQLADIESERQELTRRQEAWGTENYTDPPEVMMARQHLADTEHELWDLAPRISAAMRRAADHVGQFEEVPTEASAEEPATQEPTSESTPEPGSSEQPPAETAPKSPAEQRTSIINDRTAKLVAAGMPSEQADANAHLEAAYYETLAQRFGGKLGTAEDLYRERSARVAGPNGSAETVSPPPVETGSARPPEEPEAPAATPETAPAGPVPRPRLRTAEQIAREDGIPATKVNAKKIDAIQNQELIALSEWQAAQRAAARVPARELAQDERGPNEGERGRGLLQRASNEPPITRYRREATEIEASLPPTPDGMTRLWRGNRPGEIGFARQFTNDLAGIALPFRRSYGGDISYADVPTEDLSKYLNESGGAKGAEFLLPESVARQAARAGLVDDSGVANPHDFAPTDIAGRAPGWSYAQGAQGRISLRETGAVITLMRTADASTFMHETAHHWLEQMMGDAAHPLAPDELRADADTVRRWLKLKSDGRIPTAKHEKFARGFEQYLREGVAPSPALASVFAKFKTWLTGIYQTIKGLGAPINEDIRGVFDRMLAAEPKRTVYAPEREAPQGIGAVHLADAVETSPHEAEAVADRVAGERTRYVTEQPPEIARELTAAEPTPEPAGEPSGESEAAEPAGEDGGGTTGGGAVDRDSGQSESLAAGGGGGAERSDVSQGRGSAPKEGAGLPDRSNQRSSAGSSVGAEQFIPKPAESFTDAEPKLVDLAGNIRVENLTDVPEFIQAIHDSSERNDEFRDLRPQATKGQIFELGHALGLELSQLDSDDMEKRLSQMFGGMAEMAKKVAALRVAVIRSSGMVSTAMKTAAESGLDRDHAALGVAIARHDMMMGWLSLSTHNWGQTGNAFHSFLEGWDKAKDTNRLLKDNLGRDLFQLKMIAKMGARLDTPGKISKYLRDAKNRSFGRMLLEYWINGLISGLSTHVTYVVGGAILAAEKAGPETAASAAIGAIRSRLGREGERVRFGEVGAQFRSAVRELPAAAQAGLEALRSGATTLLPGEEARPLMPFQGDTDLVTARNMTNAPVSWGEVKGDAYALIQGMRDGLVASGELVRAGGVEGAPRFSAQYSPLGQIPDIAYKGVNVLPLGSLARLPSRNVAAIHSTFRSLNYSMEINALAYRQAASEGLTGTDLAARTADLRQNPSESMMEQARGKATDLTLMGQGGAFVNALQKLTNVEIGGLPILKFVDPFVHIAANIMDQSLVQRTPVGLLSSEIRADLLGKNGNIAQDTAAAKMLVGSAIAVAFGGLAAQGLASGSGPADPKASAMWRLAGNQAHSIRVGDIWYDVHRLGPVGMLMSVAADMYDVAHQIGKEDADVVGKSLMHAFTQNILDESFMRGPADLIKAVTDPDRYGASYVRTFLSSFVPYSVGLAQVARAADPYSRQARTIMDTIRSKIPGMSESLFPRRDIWGEPMPSGDALIAPGITAIYARQMSTDPVNQAMLDLGISPASVERSIRNVPLSDQQYDDFARTAGRSTKMRLDAIVRSPDYQSWPNATRHEVIEETIRQSREAARGWMMMRYPEIPREAVQKRVAKITGEPLQSPTNPR